MVEEYVKALRLNSSAKEVKSWRVRIRLCFATCLMASTFDEGMSHLAADVHNLHYSDHDIHALKQGSMLRDPSFVNYRG